VNTSLIEKLFALAAILGSLFIIVIMVIALQAAWSWATNARASRREPQAEQRSKKGVQHGKDLLDGVYVENRNEPVQLESHIID
jgi:hypothetical protein